MICLYHSKDLDGYCSGAIVKRRYPECKLIGWDYKDPIPDMMQFAGEQVIMIDISFPMEYMDILANFSSSVVWIDHHLSAKKDWDEAVASDKYESLGKIKYVYESGIAACEIGWKHFFRDHPIPEAVLLLGEYDTWRKGDEKRWNTRILPFQYGMRLICNSPETFPYDAIGPGGMSVVNSICKDGETILNYQKEQDKKLMYSSFVVDFEGLRALCVNVGGASSNTFLSRWDENIHDVMIPFHYTGSKWTCSIYTTKNDIDCSVIAKRYGGGGHKQASGFTLDKLPENWKK